MAVRLSQFLTACALIIAAAAAHAGGPFAVDSINNSGVALKWQNNTLSWYLDPGPLSSSVNNDTGKEWVDEQLAKWTGVTIRNADATSVATVSLNTDYKGKLDSDVDVSNYGSYVSTSSGPTAVIFDANGDITAALMGESNRGAVVGLSAPLLSDSSGRYITKGFSLFNGYILSEGSLAQDQSTAEELFKASMLHELGHLLNLDHSQVNNSTAKQCAATGTIYSRNGSCENGQYIPTMYPELLTTLQANLSRDDKVTISWIYPNSTFQSSFCMISGEIYDGDGDPLKGVNVIASRAGEGDTMTLTDARSFVSGAMKTECVGTGTYYLYGIVPGHDYQVIYEPLDPDYSGASGFEPLDNPPSGFDSGNISSTSGATTVRCETGGETMQMASTTISTLNPCTGGGGNGGDGGDGGGSSTSSSSSCTLLRDTRGGGRRAGGESSIVHQLSSIVTRCLEFIGR